MGETHLVNNANTVERSAKDMLDRKCVEKYISFLCSSLDIVPPRVHYGVEEMQSETTIAQATRGGEDIYLRDIGEQDERDVLFAIAHEIRHIWQIRKHENEFFGNYKPTRLCRNVNEYNLQKAELDANAYATAVMVTHFNCHPMFKGLDKMVKDEIYRRASGIASREEV